MTTTITLKTPIDLRGANGAGAYVETLELRDMTAGDFLDASAKTRPNASQIELEMHIASICSDVSMPVLRAMKPWDMAQISKWYDGQWQQPKAEGDDGDEDPSTAGATG